MHSKIYYKVYIVSITFFFLIMAIKRLDKLRKNYHKIQQSYTYIELFQSYEIWAKFFARKIDVKRTWQKQLSSIFLNVSKMQLYELRFTSLRVVILGVASRTICKFWASQQFTICQLRLDHCGICKLWILVCI